MAVRRTECRINVLLFCKSVDEGAVPKIGRNLMSVQYTKRKTEVEQKTTHQSM